MKPMIFSPFQALQTHCLTQKSAVEEETAALNRASLYSLGQQQYPEVQFRGAKQGQRLTLEMGKRSVMEIRGKCHVSTDSVVGTENWKDQLCLKIATETKNEIKKKTP